MDKTKKWTLLFISLSLIVVLFIGLNHKPAQQTTIDQSKEESLVENHQQDSLIIEEQDDSFQKEESISKKENKEEKKKKPHKESVHKKEEVKPIPSKPKPSKPKPSKPKPVEPEKKEIAVTLSITGHDKNGPASFLKSTTVYVDEGDTVFDVLKKASKQNGFALKTKGFGPTVYVAGINGLNEFDYGQESGWMYKVNGTRPMLGCGSYKLESHDHIEWYYVTEYVRD